MPQLARELLGGKRSAHLLVYISIKKVKANQKPTTRRAISKKHSKRGKATARKRRMKHEEPTKHHKAKRPKKRQSSPPRGVRRRQRRQQSKRVHFTMAKRALPAFFLFMAEHRPELQKSNPHWTAVETAKKLGKIWHSQPEKDKEMYKEQAARLRRKKQKRKT